MDRGTQVAALLNFADDRATLAGEAITIVASTAGAFGRNAFIMPSLRTAVVIAKLERNTRNASRINSPRINSRLCAGDQRENTQRASGSSLDLERSRHDHSAKCRQLVEVSQTLQAIAAIPVQN